MDIGLRTFGPRTHLIGKRANNGDTESTSSSKHYRRLCLSILYHCAPVTALHPAMHGTERGSITASLTRQSRQSSTASSQALHCWTPQQTRSQGQHQPVSMPHTRSRSSLKYIAASDLVADSLSRAHLIRNEATGTEQRTSSSRETRGSSSRLKTRVCEDAVVLDSLQVSGQDTRCTSDCPS